MPLTTSASFQPRFRFLDAGVHALRAGRAVDVGGVAGEEDAAGPVAGGVAVMQPEVGQPDRVAQPQAAAGVGVGDGLQVGEGHLRPFLVVPAPRGRIPSIRHVAGRASGKKNSIPPAPRKACADVALQLAVHLEIAEDERLRIRPAFERDCRRPGGRCCGRRRSRPRSAHAPLRPFRPGGGVCRGRFPRRPGLDELDAPLDLDALLAEVLVQDCLGLGLGHEQQEWVGGVLEADVEQPHRDDALAGVEP